MRLSINLSSEEQAIFDYFKSLIEEEREIRSTDLDCIAMLATQVSLYEEARKSVKEDGALIHTDNSYGRTVKANPANQVAEKAQIAIKAYLGELLLTPKAKAQLSKSIIEKDSEDDPLAAALKKRAENR